ncbi:MAG: cytochrome c family protein [Proteobacteria bacterium]|nr:cytochrome c family protein [Pseudomonadota bacterium]MBU1709186.1 cytochrome c family protein [Pseudomonadota bacterium]
MKIVGIAGLMFLLGIVLLSVTVSIAEDRGPETMNFKERFKFTGTKDPVIFKHWEHQENLEKKCSNCHLKEEGGGKLKVELIQFEGVRNDFHNKFCWPCHRSMDVPKGASCKTCHQ